MLPPLDLLLEYLLNLLPPDPFMPLHPQLGYSTRELRALQTDFPRGIR